MYSLNVGEINYLPGLECEPAEQSFLCDEFLLNNLLKNKIVLQVREAFKKNKPIRLISRD